MCWAFGFCPLCPPSSQLFSLGAQAYFFILNHYSPLFPTAHTPLTDICLVKRFTYLPNLTNFEFKILWRTTLSLCNCLDPCFLPAKTKILLVPLKCKIIMVLSNNRFFQNHNSNIGPFFIAPCKFVALNLLCLIFCIYNYFGSFLYFLFIALQTIAIAINVALSRS